MSELKFTTEINSVISFGAFDEKGDLLISSEDPTDGDYVSFYINKEEAQQIVRHLTRQLTELDTK